MAVSTGLIFGHEKQSAYGQVYKTHGFLIFPVVYSATTLPNSAIWWLYKGGVKGLGTPTAGGAGDGTLPDMDVQSFLNEETHRNEIPHCHAQRKRSKAEAAVDPSL